MFSMVVSFTVILSTILPWLLNAQELNSTLHSTFYGVNFAYDGEMVTFTCVARNSTLIAWSSNEYIGSDGLRLEFASIERVGTNRFAPNFGTTAQLVDSFREDGRVILVSQLNITVPSVYQISSITCHNIGMGTTAMTSFQLAGMDQFLYLCNIFMLYAAVLIPETLVFIA